MNKLTISFLLIFLLSLPLLLAQDFLKPANVNKESKNKIQEKLNFLFLHNKYFSQITFPAKAVIDIKLDGSYDKAYVEKTIEQNGIGSRFGDLVTIKSINLTDNTIEIFFRRTFFQNQFKVR